MWPCIVLHFLKWNQLVALTSQIYSWNKILHVSDSSSVHHQEFFTVHSNGICHKGLLTACKQNQDETAFYPDSARQLSANLQDINYCCVCTVKNSWWWTEKLSETCRVSFQEYMWEIIASSWFYCKIFKNVLFLRFSRTLLVVFYTWTQISDMSGKLLTNFLCFEPYLNFRSSVP